MRKLPTNINLKTITIIDVESQRYVQTVTIDEWVTEQMIFDTEWNIYIGVDESGKVWLLRGDEWVESTNSWVNV